MILGVIATASAWVDLDQARIRQFDSDTQMSLKPLSLVDRDFLT